MFAKIMAAVATLAAAIMLAPNASADDSSFLAALHASGQFDGSDDAAVLALGHEYCDAKDQSQFGIGGFTPQQAALQAWRAHADSLGITLHSPRSMAFSTAMPELCKL